MLFSYAVRALYIESSAMFVRAGVYRVVKEAMGGTLAKLSVSALLFDYVLTGPISGVSAGRYIAGLANDLLARGGLAVHLPEGLVASVIAIAITRLLLVAQHARPARVERRRAADHADHDRDGRHPDPVVRADAARSAAAACRRRRCRRTCISRTSRSAGCEGTVWPTFTAVAIFVGFGHSILAMSGEESLAQVYREIEQPKVKNLQRAGHDHLRLQPAVHRTGQLLRDGDHSGLPSGRSSTTT